MQVIFNDTGLSDVKAPCVAQTFIDHNAVLYKVYAIDHVFFVMERPSLKNLKAEQFDTIYFHSHSVSKPHSASYLNEVWGGMIEMIMRRWGGGAFDEEGPSSVDKLRKKSNKYVKIWTRITFAPGLARHLSCY